MLFLGRRKDYVYLRKIALGVLRRSNSVCCPFPFLMLILARRTFPSLYVIVSLSYVTQSLISFSCPYYHYKIIYLQCVKSSSLYHFFFQYFV